MNLTSPSALTGGGWERVTTGQSGAIVLRSADGSRYAKFMPADERGALEAERDRMDWALDHDVPTAEVIDWATSSEWACLLTSTLPGVPADRLSPSDLWQAWPSITASLRRLHDLPTDDCPFDRGLTAMSAIADDVVARGAVNAEFLPVDVRQRPAADLLKELADELPHRLVEEQADLVVCHGDLCLPNLLIDPASHAVTGFIDLGRLGRADRYADIALLLANSRGTWTDEQQAAVADALFADAYGITLSPDRRQFYLCLDALTWDTTTPPAIG